MFGVHANEWANYEFDLYLFSITKVSITYLKQGTDVKNRSQRK